MAAQTGENEHAMRKILDMTRFISITILALHFYHTCYALFNALEWESSFTNQVFQNIFQTGLLETFHRPKWISVLFLFISMMGKKGCKDEKLNFQTALLYLTLGIVIYFSTYFIWMIKSDYQFIAWVYITLTSLGFLLILSGGTILSRIIKQKIDHDIFNPDPETFPQEERLLINEYLVNLSAEYQLKGKKTKSLINIINGFRGLLVLGTPGSGKSYFVIRHVITNGLRRAF